MATTTQIASRHSVPSSPGVDSPPPPHQLGDLVHDVNNDLGVAIGVLDTVVDSLDLSVGLRRLAEAGLQRLLHAQAIVQSLPQRDL